MKTVSYTHLKVEANVGAPQVAYKESFTKAVDVDSKYAKQSGGRGQYGHCKVKFEPTDVNGEMCIRDSCAHNPKCGVKAKTNLQYAVLAADPMSGFVKAVAQIYPDKMCIRDRDYTGRF